MVRCPIHSAAAAAARCILRRLSAGKRPGDVSSAAASAVGSRTGVRREATVACRAIGDMQCDFSRRETKIEKKTVIETENIEKLTLPIALLDRQSDSDNQK